MAGAVIGVAIGVAILTFLITFLLMRRKHRQSQASNHSAPMPQTREYPAFESDKPIVTASPMGPEILSSYLPQSADDTAVQGHATTVLDQLGLYVENFYKNNADSGSRPNRTEIAAFDSHSLPGQLSALLQTSRNPTSLIQHALAHLVITSISAEGIPAHSFLPAEFVLLPSKIAQSKPTESGKLGKLFER